MQEIKTASASGPEGVHAESRMRDSSFMMTGHHCHGCCEMFYVESGACRFLINDGIQDLRAGDFILVPPMALHYTRYLSGPCRRTVILFDRESVGEENVAFLPGAERFLTEAGVYQVPAAYQAQVGGLIQKIVAEDKIGDSRSAVLRKIYLQALLVLCGRVCIVLSDPPDDIHTTDQQVLQAARYIIGHYMHPVTTLDVARAVGFSPNYLSRKFHQAAGIGLHAYLVFVRLHHAAQELVSTDDSITTIALRCGFSDSNYFKDSFKKKFGVTPRQYRKKRSAPAPFSIAFPWGRCYNK